MRYESFKVNVMDTCQGIMDMGCSVPLLFGGPTFQITISIKAAHPTAILKISLLQVIKHNLISLYFMIPGQIKIFFYKIPTFKSKAAFIENQKIN